MRHFNNKIASVSAALLLTVGTTSAQAITVDLELLLLVDVSGSVDNAEYNLQKQGYVNAFNDPGIQTLIAAKPNGIAVAYAEWSGASQQSLEVGWTHLTDASSANTFALAINSATRDFGGVTAPGSAINWGASNTGAAIFDNNFEGGREVIDVSGDGQQNSGLNTAAARDAALLAGIDAINGLAITTDDPNLGTWYANNIQGGANSFTITVSNFNDFENAVTTKIGREINNIPEPASLLLLAAGLLGFCFVRRQNI